MFSFFSKWNNRDLEINFVFCFEGVLDGNVVIKLLGIFNIYICMYAMLKVFEYSYLKTKKQEYPQN